MSPAKWIIVKFDTGDSLKSFEKFKVSSNGTKLLGVLHEDRSMFGDTLLSSSLMEKSFR